MYNYHSQLSYIFLCDVSIKKVLNIVTVEILNKNEIIMI